MFFISPAEAQTFPPCCTEAGTPPADGDPEQDRPPFLVPAEVRRPEERALEATAEAPIPVEVPLVDAIGVPLEERPGVSEPEFVPARLRIVEPPPVPVDAVVPAAPLGAIIGPPCCQLLSEPHPPDAREPEQAPLVPIGAEVRKRDERALETAAEAPLPVETPLVDAVGIPLEERPGVSEPEFVPARASDRPARQRAIRANDQLILAVLAILLAIGFGLSRCRRRPPLELEPIADPVSRPPLPDALTRLLAAPAPLEPVTPKADRAAPAREVEPEPA